MVTGPGPQTCPVVTAEEPGTLDPAGLRLLGTPRHGGRSHADGRCHQITEAGDGRESLPPGGLGLASIGLGEAPGACRTEP